jgi:adenylate cyclase
VPIPTERAGIEDGRYGRKLTAVLHADVVGYSRLIGVDDLSTLARLRAIRETLVEPAVNENGGRIVQTAGDSLLIAFDSIAGAVNYAVRVQSGLNEQESVEPPERRIQFRIGINIGDVITEGADIHGDSVNVAVRLQEVCPAGGICVSRAVREHVADGLKLDFQPMGALTLKNISRPVEAYALRLGLDPDAFRRSPIAATVIRQWEKPSLAVLPFTNMSDEADEEYFSDGIAEDIITELSRSRSLFVVARNSSFNYKGMPFDVRQIAQELGVRYIHEGSVRRSGGRIRVNAQLIDAETGNHLWAERYDRDLADLFAVQDEITNAIAGTIQPVISMAEQRRAVRKPPHSLSAWEAYQRGTWHRDKLDPEENIRARELFRRAIEFDPTFALPHHGLAQTYFDDAHLYLIRTFADAATVAQPLANKAVMLDPNDANGYVALALVSAAQGDLQTEMARVERALELSPNNAAAHGMAGQCLVFSGRYDEGCHALMTFLRRNPCDPRRGPMLYGLAVGRYLMKEYIAAAELAMRALAAQPNLRDMRRWLIAALGKLGRLDDAKSMMRQTTAMLAPVAFEEFLRRQQPWLRDVDHAHLMDGLRAAGWQG